MKAWSFFAMAALVGMACVLGYGLAWAAHTAAVTIDNFTFQSPELTVAAGTAVTWTNSDDIPHTVVLLDGSQPLRSPALDTDDHFTITFDKAGTYRYFCSLHPQMQGMVVVE